MPKAVLLLPVLLLSVGASASWQDVPAKDFTAELAAVKKTLP